MEGNRNQTNDTIRIYQALKDNIMESLRVCSICYVKSVQSDTVTCQPVNRPSVFIECIDLQENPLSADSLVVVLYTDEDTRDNINRIKQGIEPVEINNDKVKHNQNYGIIIKDISHIKP